MECRVGLPNDNQKRWRCFICSQLNLWDNNACKRCQEPVSETQKLENKLKMPQTSFQTQNKSYTNGTRTKARPNNKRKFDARSRNNSLQSSNASIGSPAKKSRHEMYTFNSKGKVSKMSKQSAFQSTNKQLNSMKKLSKVDMSEKHLGYKASKKSNTHTFVRSKLNHDTASYRAKFAGKGNPNDLPSNVTGMKKGMRVATVNDLTRNGFQTSVAENLKNKQQIAAAKNRTSKNLLPRKTGSNKANLHGFQHHNGTSSKTSTKPLNPPPIDKKEQARLARIRKLNDERPVTPPPNKRTGKRSLIDQLQKAHTGEIMANLRHGGRYMRPETKRMEGGKTRYKL